MTVATDPSGPRFGSGEEVVELWNLVPDALLAVEPSGRIAAANRAASEVFGGSDEELVGRPIESLLRDGDRAVHVGHRCEWTMSPRARLMGSSRVLPARTLDGRRIDVQVALNPMTIGDRSVTIAVVRDVTHDTATLRRQAAERDEIVQRLFGLGMSLRSVIPSVGRTEAVGRISAVVDGMGEVADNLSIDAVDGHRRRERGGSYLDDGSDSDEPGPVIANESERGGAR